MQMRTSVPMNPPAHRVLLLGAGFIGSAVQAAFLARRWAVEPVGRQALDLTARGAHESLAARVDRRTIIVFTAAVTPDRDRSDGAEALNRAMTSTVARAVTQSPPAALVFLGSTSVYGEPAGDRTLTEDSPLAPGSPYARGKLEAEERLREVSRSCDVPFLVLRPSLVYGPGDTHVQYGPSTLVRDWLAGDVHLYGDGEDARDFVFVDDLAWVLVALVEQGATGLFNVAGGSATFGGVVNLLRRLDPRDDVHVTHRPRSIPLSRVSFDISRLRDRVHGFPFVSLEEGLRRTLEAFRSGVEGVP